MKEAQFVSILAHPRVDFCAEVVANHNRQLVIAYSLKGQNANSFCKDLAQEFSGWHISSPENLHQKILDLLVFTRQAKLELAFSLACLPAIDQPQLQIILASFNGQIILQRKQQAKIILESVGEIKMIVGNWQANDQIILSNQAAKTFNENIFKLLEAQVSQEKLIASLSLLQNQKQDLESSLALVTYQEKIFAATQVIQHSQKQKIQNLFKKIQTIALKIPNFFKKIKDLIKKIYTWLKKQNRKKVIIALLAILACIIISTTIGLWLKQDKQKKLTAIQTQIELIKQETSQIDQLVLQQPLLAREKAQTSLIALQNLKKENNQPSSAKLIDAAIAQLENQIAQIAGENSLDRLSIAYDLGSFLGTKIALANDNIFVLESNNQEILKINADRSQEKIALANTSKLQDFTISDNKLFILSNGLQMLDLLAKERGFSTIKQTGESDREANQLESFGPYLYLINKNKRNIYRYYYHNDQLSEPIGWLIDKQGLSFEQINDLAVDGDLWLTTKSGQIMKFSKGSQVDFQIKGLGSLPNSPLTLSTNEQIDRLAVLEKQNKRLLILTKDGQLINEIKSNELSGVSSITFNSNGQKIYALSGSIIYEITL